MCSTPNECVVPLTKKNNSREKKSSPNDHISSLVPENLVPPPCQKIKSENGNERLSPYAHFPHPNLPQIYR